MDLKSDLSYFIRMHKKAVVAALLTVFIVFAVFACSGIRYEIRLNRINQTEPLTSQDRTYYNHLTYRQQILYDAVLDAAKAQKKTTGTIPYRYTKDEFVTVMDFLAADHPALFSLDPETCSLRNGWNASEVRLSYYAQDDTLNQMTAAFDRAVNFAVNLIGQRTTEYETALAIHDYLIHHTALSDETLLGDTAYGALVECEATGLGYARAFDVLCARFGISSYTVFGKSGDTVLAWNVHCADGLYYHTDVCYDDPNWEDPVLFHGFFGLTEAEITAGRTVTYPNVLPASEQNASYYEKNGLLADSVSTMRTILVEQIKKAAKTSERFIEIRISFSDDVSLFEDVIGESIRHAKSDDPDLPLRDDFRVFSDTDANGAATIELFYHN